ncbi:aspartokinase [Desulfosarcina alkanivorans]|uniref:Aspartokinase n=1 Tax=Desulfosarcina alkanivorans TaxID=571177 RepID=A0A5K7YV73_9BACT|nr:aspartate kinase [Desulfosarcina alkanivorans]BBO71913.1 aspartokinase [Desulfosarcina alkanivorans]
MACIVQKYGGSSLSDVDKIMQVARMIAGVKATGMDVAAVVSAMGKTTNGLVEMARSISSKPARREMDMLLSTGERITMSLLCMALNELGVASVSLTGSQCGIITNHRHNDAQVIEVRPFRVMDEMAEGKVVVVGGFQGVSYRRDITTLGRGGSDTTAVALAAAIDAERCEIYSDVDGVYSSDPSVVADARHLPEVSYPVMQEMSAAGAKVLNAQAVQFAKEKKIAIYAGSTFDRRRETVVRKLPTGQVAGVQAVVSEKEITRVRISGDRALVDFRWALDFLEGEQVPVKEVHAADVSADPLPSQVSFVVSASNIYGWKDIRDRLVQRLGASVRFDAHLSALSLIGEGLNRTNATLIEALALLENHGIVVAAATTTSFRISLLVPREKIDAGVRLCHGHWISKMS